MKEFISDRNFKTIILSFAVYEWVMNMYLIFLLSKVFEIIYIFLKTKAKWCKLHRLLYFIRAVRMPCFGRLLQLMGN